MLLPRITPVLLIRNKGLIKTKNFKDDKYVGDPLNAVKIFNEKKVDELIVLDIDATVKNTEPDFKMIEDLAGECRMPLCYGGGIKNYDQALKILSLGVEKVSISSAAIENPNLIKALSDKVGSQSVVVTLDVKKKFLRGYEVMVKNGLHQTKSSPEKLAELFEKLGAGEILINSIDRDGEMNGYDIGLIRSVKDSVNIPMTVLGGCGSLNDISKLYNEFGIIGAGAGSIFVFKGKYRAVLIDYPNDIEKSFVTNIFN